MSSPSILLRELFFSCHHHDLLSRLHRLSLQSSSASFLSGFEPLGFSALVTDWSIYSSTSATEFSLLVWHFTASFSRWLSFSTSIPSFFDFIDGTTSSSFQPQLLLSSLFTLHNLLCCDPFLLQVSVFSLNLSPFYFRFVHLSVMNDFMEASALLISQ